MTSAALSRPSNSNSISESASTSKKTEVEEEEARPSVSVYQGELSYEAFKNPANNPVALALALCGVADIRNKNTFLKRYRTKGDGVFREVLATFFAELRQGETVDNRAAALTKRLDQFPDITAEPKSKKKPEAGTKTANQAPTILRQTATALASGLCNPKQTDGKGDRKADGLEVDLLNYADKNGITQADGQRCAPGLVEIAKLGYGEALNKLPTRAKYAFACLWLDGDEDQRRNLLSRLEDNTPKPTAKQGADTGEEMPF
jgi:hypothetical protein